VGLSLFTVVFICPLVQATIMSPEKLAWSCRESSSSTEKERSIDRTHTRQGKKLIRKRFVVIGGITGWWVLIKTRVFENRWFLFYFIFNFCVCWFQEKKKRISGFNKTSTLWTLCSLSNGSFYLRRGDGLGSD